MSMIKSGLSYLYPSKEAVAVAVATRPDAPEWRLELADAIARNEVDVKYPHCDLDKLKQLVTIPKNSVSVTGIFFANHDGPGAHRDVTIKASFAPTSDQSLAFDNSLVIERVNYQLVGNELIRRRWSPHIASYVASFQCPTYDLMKLPSAGPFGVIKEVMYTRPTETKKKTVKSKCFPKEPPYNEKTIVQSVKKDAEKENKENKSFYELKEGQYDLDNVNFVLTERMKGKQLEKWMKQPHSLAEWKSVLWQILYTLEVFNRIGFRHNDLHLGNAFIEDLSGTGAPDNTMYVTDLDETNGWSYTVVPTKKNNVRIFDFDRSTLLCEAGSYNKAYKAFIEQYRSALPTGCVNTRMASAPFLKSVKEPFIHCKDEGACQLKNEKFDAFTVLGLLWAAEPKNYKKMTKIYGDDSGALFGEDCDAEIPAEVLAFIEKHLHKPGARFNPLTMRWGWPYRMVGVERKGKAWFATEGNMELDDREMSTVMDMLNDTDFFDFPTGDKSTFNDDCKDAFVYHLPMRPNSDDLDLDGLTCDDDVSGKLAPKEEAPETTTTMQEEEAETKTIKTDEYIIDYDPANDEWTITVYPNTYEEETYVFNPKQCAMARQGLTVKILKDICEVVTSIETTKMKKAEIVEKLEEYLRTL